MSIRHPAPEHWLKASRGELADLDATSFRDLGQAPGADEPYGRAL